MGKLRKLGIGFGVILLGLGFSYSTDVYAVLSIDAPLTLDDDGSVGAYTSIAIGTDGFPVISYRDETNYNLKLVHCTSVDCSTTDTPITLDSTGSVGTFTSIAIGTDEFPVISYRDSTNQDLKLVHCTSVDCSTTDTPITLDSIGNVGRYTSIAIGTDGFPVISYNNDSNRDLKLVHCTSVDCSTTDTPITLDSIGAVGKYTSITIGTDGFPVISYSSNSNKDLKLVHCTSVDCSTTDTPITLDSIGSVGRYNSIAIGTDGFPVISYRDETNYNLKLVHCTSVDCSTTDTPITLDSIGSIGTLTSIAIGTDGFPVISYYDFTSTNLKLVYCTSVDCSTVIGVLVVDDQIHSGWYSSIAIGTDGFPVISYYDNTNYTLRLVHCLTKNCEITPAVCAYETLPSLDYGTLAKDATGTLTWTPSITDSDAHIQPTAITFSVGNWTNSDGGDVVYNVNTLLNGTSGNDTDISFSVDSNTVFNFTHILTFPDTNMYVSNIGNTLTQTTTVATTCE